MLKLLIFLSYSFLNVKNNNFSYLFKIFYSYIQILDILIYSFRNFVLGILNFKKYSTDFLYSLKNIYMFIFTLCIYFLIHAKDSNVNTKLFLKEALKARSFIDILKQKNIFIIKNLFYYCLIFLICLYRYDIVKNISTHTLYFSDIEFYLENFIVYFFKKYRNIEYEFLISSFDEINYVKSYYSFFDIFFEKNTCYSVCLYRTFYCLKLDKKYKKCNTFVKDFTILIFLISLLYYI